MRGSSQGIGGRWGEGEFSAAFCEGVDVAGLIRGTTHEGLEAEGTARDTEIAQSI